MENDHPRPVISVVMGVYNGADSISRTVDSVLAQRSVSLELIAVDDGSSDDTCQILEAAAERDARVRVLRQEHLGLTAALITGCKAAEGQFVARQDCGDISRPDRLRLQLAHHREDSDRVLISCATRYIAPGGEPLHVSSGRIDDEEVRTLLLEGDVNTIRGLSHHGTAFFSREIYERAGGYRREMKLAQDVDLWIRMAALGKISFLQDILYDATISPDSLSIIHRQEQIRYASAAIVMRDAGQAERERLLEILRNSQASDRDDRGHRRREAEGYYFIARALHDSPPPVRRSYFRKAIGSDPLFLRAWIGLLRGR